MLIIFVVLGCVLILVIVIGNNEIVFILILFGLKLVLFDILLFIVVLGFVNVIVWFVVWLLVLFGLGKLISVGLGLFIMGIVGGVFGLLFWGLVSGGVKSVEV